MQHSPHSGTPDAKQAPTTLVSVVAPAYDEAGNISLLAEKIDRAFEQLPEYAPELVIVDDGSTDGTFEEALEARRKYGFVHVRRHRRNLGKSAALNTAFAVATGEIIITLDADLQCDPEEDIPKLLHKLAEGYDMVTGWRQQRREGKALASRVFNWMVARLFDVQVHDINWVKAFRRELLPEMRLRDGQHRVMPILAHHHGYSLAEVKTHWYPRHAGTSKYGFFRIPDSIFDVLSLRLVLSFSRRPMVLFGSAGAVATLIGIGMTVWLGVLYFVEGTQIRPLFITGITLVMLGLVIFLIGFIADLVVSLRTRVEDLEDRILRRE